MVMKMWLVIRTHLSLLDRMRLLTQLCRGVAELHDKDVIHGDLKLENVLLSGLNQPDIRIADFGLSQLREDGDNNSTGQSATRMTTHFKGTPKYSAPEMLVYKDGGMAKASKSTDMYALGIMAHEILSGRKPFDDITNVGKLTVEVGTNGMRPSLDKLPNEVSTSLREMIAACWDGDKRKRYSAMQCYALVSQELSLLQAHSFDVYLSHASPTHVAFVSILSGILARYGYKIFISPTATRSVYLGADLWAFSYTKQPVITVLLEGNINGWGNDDLKQLCGVKSTGGVMYVELSGFATSSEWASPDGPSEELSKQMA